jgi:hypothetical protein
MADALRHARILHYAIIGLSLAVLMLLVQTNPLAAVYSQARSELAILSTFLGRSPSSQFAQADDPARMQRARNVISNLVRDHVHRVLSRNLSMALGGDVDAAVSLQWEVPIAHQSRLPLDSDLLEIRSHFAAIPIVVLQADLAELAWLLTSRFGAEELRSIRSMTIRLEPATPLEEHVRRHGFEASDEPVATHVVLTYARVGGEVQQIESPLVGRIARVPDLNQRATFHNSFANLERVFHLVEYQTPEQADLTLNEKEREARAGLLRGASASRGLRMAALLVTPILLLLLLSHVRHLLDGLPGTAPAEVGQLGWFPLFPDANSRSFEVMTFMLLPASGPAAWLFVRWTRGMPIPVEDLLLYLAASAACLWIGASIRTELVELRACIQEVVPNRSRRAPPGQDPAAPA